MNWAACIDRHLQINTAYRRCRDLYLQTVMRFFRSTPTLRADAFFDVRPIAIAVWMQPDSIQRRPRGLFGIRAQARTSPSSGPVSYKHPLSSAGSHGCCYWWRRRRTGATCVKSDTIKYVTSGWHFQNKAITTISVQFCRKYILE